MSLSIARARPSGKGSSSPPSSSWASSSQDRRPRPPRPDDHRRPRRVGVFQALYGLFRAHPGRRRLLLYAKVFQPRLVTGTFVNRNHLSGYLEMVIPLALGLAVARMNLMAFGSRLPGEGPSLDIEGRPGERPPPRRRRRHVARHPAVPFPVRGRRPGLHRLPVLRLIGLLVQPDRFRQPWVGRSIRITFLAVVALAVVVGVGSTVRRFALDDLLQEDRPLYWANTVEMIGDFPVFGRAGARSLRPTAPTRRGPPRDGAPARPQ